MTMFMTKCGNASLLRGKFGEVFYELLEIVVKMLSGCADVFISTMTR